MRIYLSILKIILKSFFSLILLDILKTRLYLLVPYAKNIESNGKRPCVFFTFNNPNVNEKQKEREERDGKICLRMSNLGSNLLTTKGRSNGKCISCW